VTAPTGQSKQSEERARFDRLRAILATRPGYVDWQSVAWNVGNTGYKAELLAKLSPAAQREIMHAWPFWARPKQLLPLTPWRVCLMQPGRGFGKTKAGAEWIRERVEAGALSIGIVGATASDVLNVMVPALLDVWPPDKRPVFNQQHRSVTFHTGAVATYYTGEKPDRMRGPNHDTYWIDELAAHKYAAEVDRQVAMSARRRSAIGVKILITTTPRPTPTIRKIVAAAKRDEERPVDQRRYLIVRGSTRENAACLDAVFLEELYAEYAGTRIGQQELDGVVLDETEGALWRMAWIDRDRVQAVPRDACIDGAFRRVVVAVDPTVSDSSDSDECGIVAAALGYDGQVYVLEDGSARLRVEEWPRVVGRMCTDHAAVEVVAESNQGGELVRKALVGAGVTVRITMVSAKHGKALRAEPVVQVYEKGRVHHVGALPRLEDQMTTWIPYPVRGVKESTKSPDRVDALVYAILALCPPVRPAVAPKVHASRYEVGAGQG